jgi:hypothetical protein
MKLSPKLLLSVAAITLAGGLQIVIANPVTPPAIGTPVPVVKPGMPVTDVQRPTEALVGARVKDNKGEAVGEVKAVKLGPNGKVVAVDVDVGAKVVALKPETLQFAAGDRTVISKQSKAEIQALGAM